PRREVRRANGVARCGQRFALLLGAPPAGRHLIVEALPLDFARYVLRGVVDDVAIRKAYQPRVGIDGVDAVHLYALVHAQQAKREHRLPVQLVQAARGGPDARGWETALRPV